MDVGKFEYIKSRRRKFMVLFFTVLIFGTVLFAFSRHAKIDNTVVAQQEVEEGKVSKLYRRIVADEMEAIEVVSRNILSEPVAVNYKLDGERLAVLTRINLKGEQIKSPVFDIKKRGGYIYSGNFSSEDGQTHCKGVMEEGSDKFFVYYCSKKQ